MNRGEHPESSYSYITRLNALVLLSLFSDQVERHQHRNRREENSDSGRLLKR